jgi:heme/copper-type cytochrome/quinol oxidase subunit 1
MVYLAATPGGGGAGGYFVPLLVGAAGVARPRLALAGTWM